MIYAMEDAEDVHTAIDGRERWRETATRELHAAYGELRGLFVENWKRRHKEADLFIAAICELTRKLESVQALKDQFHWACTDVMRECKNKVTQVHYALSDVTEALGEARKTMREANETIKQLQRLRETTTSSHEVAEVEIVVHVQERQCCEAADNTGVIQ